MISSAENERTFSFLSDLIIKKSNRLGLKIIDAICFLKLNINYGTFDK